MFTAFPTHPWRSWNYWQSKHWQLWHMEGYFSWWTFSLLKSWQMQVLSQENLDGYYSITDLTEEVTLHVSTRIRNKATINETHPPCKSVVINTDHTLSTSVWVCSTEIITNLSSAKQQTRDNYFLKIGRTSENLGFTGPLSNYIFIWDSDFVLVKSSHNSSKILAGISNLSSAENFQNYISLKSIICLHRI